MSMTIKKKKKKRMNVGLFYIYIYIYIYDWIPSQFCQNYIIRFVIFNLSHFYILYLCVCVCVGGVGGVGFIEGQHTMSTTSI